MNTAVLTALCLLRILLSSPNVPTRGCVGIDTAPEIQIYPFLTHKKLISLFLPSECPKWLKGPAGLRLPATRPGSAGLKLFEETTTHLKRL